MRQKLSYAFREFLDENNMNFSDTRLLCTKVKVYKESNMLWKYIISALPLTLCYISKTFVR